jgi:superfamily II DNA or RNA helicase
MLNTSTVRDVKIPSLCPFKLRPYQDTAVAAVLSDLQTLTKVGMIMPTGSGKTEVFIRVAEHYLAANPQKSVLILSHLSLLTVQTAQRFALRAPNITVGIFQAGETPPVTAKVIIGTMQTSRAEGKAKRLKLRQLYPVGLIIIDEAHYLTCDSYEAALAEHPDAKQIGCTATPFRAGALMTNYYDKISFSISLKELIDQKYLVPPNLIEVQNDDPETEGTMALIASLYKEREHGKSALVFMKTIEDAKQMRNVFDDNRIKASAITSDLVGEERDKILAEFKAGRIQVLTTVNVLTAGFDSPNVEAIFMPFPTKSPTTYLQRIGRGLRICPEIGKTECRIYVCGNSPSIKKELYRKLQDNVLLVNSTQKKTTTFEDDFEYGEDTNDEIYRWNKAVCDTIKRMRELSMTRLADILNFKKFPKRFMDDIGKFAEGLPNVNYHTSTDPATQAQIKMLIDLGFNSECCTGISKIEASALIAGGLNVREEWKKRPFIFPSGKMAGQHVSKANPFYVNMIKTKYPNSSVAKLLAEFEKAGGTYDNPARKSYPRA